MKKTETVILLHNQSLLDVAVQVTGNPINALWIAQQNGLIPSDEVPAGTLLKIPNGLKNDNDIKRYYKANNILPATGITEHQQIMIDGCGGGISCWAVNVDFVVS